MSGWAGENPRGKHGEHHYHLEDFGFDPDAVRAQYGFYMQRFAVPVEA